MPQIFDSATNGMDIILDVSELSSIIVEDLDDPRLQNIRVRGEISNLSNRGHLFFSLCEQRGEKKYLIDCVMWKSNAEQLNLQPKDGMVIIAYGSVQVYEVRGRYQLYIYNIKEEGVGDLYLMVEQWKRELTEEGIFDAKKKPLPPMPTRVGVVTSPDAAAFQDIKNIISRRFPVELVLSPTVVQGEMAHIDIAEAIRQLDGKVDVIIVGRGGGSFEDLFAFNHPDVVHAIADCITPVVSAIGHETDYVLADFAADRRASTPSMAAEIVVPDRNALLEEIRGIKDRMRNDIRKTITRTRADVEEMRRRLLRQRLDRKINEKRQDLADLEEGLRRALIAKIGIKRMEINQCAAVLSACSPAEIMTRGYCVVRRGGSVVRSIKELKSGNRVSIRFIDGKGVALMEELFYDKKEGYDQ